MFYLIIISPQWKYKRLDGFIQMTNIFITPYVMYFCWRMSGHMCVFYILVPILPNDFSKILQSSTTLWRVS